VKDQLNRTVHLSGIPRRIVSLVPSQTELLYDLGLDEEVVGITKFCVHPRSWFQTKKRVGGTKKLHIEIIRQLQPDLIIANKEENNQSDIEALEKEFPVWVSDIQNIQDALGMIVAIGEITAKEHAARQLILHIQTAFNQPIPKKRTAVYAIWCNPWMFAGKDTFITEMMREAGFENIIQDSRYPILDEEQIKSLNPEYILLSSEPFPFAEKHKTHWKNILPDTEVILVDGEYFSWYGSRMLKAIDYFRTLNETL
jgi:ABC-type Fe3+-hydroxamate transport system substrate-binding protein